MYVKVNTLSDSPEEIWQRMDSLPLGSVTGWHMAVSTRGQFWSYESALAPEKTVKHHQLFEVFSVINSLQTTKDTRDSNRPIQSRRLLYGLVCKVDALSTATPCLVLN